MTEKKYVRRNDREKEKENARRTFFFCLLSKCSIRLFFSPSASQKKSGKKKSVVFNS